MRGAYQLDLGPTTRGSVLGPRPGSYDECPIAPAALRSNSRAVIRVLVVDDHPAVRRSLEQFLGGVADIDCVATAPDGVTAVSLCAEHAPDVVVMDISMPGMDGIAATASIRETHPASSVIVFTGWGSPELRARAAAAGAAAYLLKDDEPEALLLAIRQAAERGYPLSSA